MHGAQVAASQLQLTLSSINRESSAAVFVGKPIPWSRELLSKDNRVDTTAKERRYVDGALLYELRVPFGYWESKDEKDDLEVEIALKFRRGQEDAF